jgi:hypothetical membrane protein
MSQTVCDPATRVTKSLLGYGVIVGPVYVVVSLAQALTREGFDPTRHAWSVLANGDLGWIQVTNLVVTGLMVLAASVGLHRAIGGWAPRLLAVYGVSLVAAGIFKADPAPDFPVGVQATTTPHGTLHFVAGGIGFACLIAACFVVARRVRRLATFSRVTGVLFLAGFLAIASGGTWAVLPFTAAVLLAWTWLSMLSLHHYRAEEN